jgi:hypothetical protein
LAVAMRYEDRSRFKPNKAHASRHSPRRSTLRATVPGYNTSFVETGYTGRSTPADRLPMVLHPYRRQMFVRDHWKQSSPLRTSNRMNHSISSRLLTAAPSHLTFPLHPTHHHLILFPPIHLFHIPHISTESRPCTTSSPTHTCQRVTQPNRLTRSSSPAPRRLGYSRPSPAPASPSSIETSTLRPTRRPASTKRDR